MKTHKEIESYLLSLPNTKLDYPFGKEVAVYKTLVGDEEKMYAIIAEKSDPVRISLKCDPQLAVLLREKYESVMEGYHLNKKHWNTILVTGQLSDDDLSGLILHSYQLVAGVVGHVPEIVSTRRKSR